MKMLPAVDALQVPLDVHVTAMVAAAVKASERESGVSRDRIVNDALCQFFALPTAEGDAIPVSTSADDFWEGDSE